MALDHLTLHNFRRHENTTIDFSTDSQIVAVTGRNGMGKSTLLTEAILWALYGESRHGRRQLSGMVRRGAEHEGMQVELGFTVGNTSYRVVRRWEKTKHSAALYANENLKVQTADAVTAEVTRILGMDSVGFRLATVAKQKELDGLTDLTASKRSQVLTRLLRLDAVQAAAKDARTRYNRERDVAQAMAGGPSVSERQAYLTDARTEQAETDGALNQAREAMLAIDVELAATSDVEQAHTAAMIAVTRAEATATAAGAELDRLQAELSRVVVPAQMSEPSRSLEQIGIELSEVDTLIARGEAAATIAQQARHTTRELDRVTSRIEEITKSLAGETPASVAMAIAALGQERDAHGSRRQELAAAREELLAEHGTVSGRISDLKGRLEAAHALGDTCDTCDQDIPAEHKVAQHERRTAELAAATARAQEILTAGKVLKTNIDEVDAATGDVQDKLRALSSRQAEVTALSREMAEARRRQQTYTEQLGRLHVEDIDLEDAYARKGRLSCDKTEAEAYAQNAAARAAAMSRQDDLTAKVTDAQHRKDAAEATAAAAAPDEDLLHAYAHRQKLAAQREDERNMVEACAAASAGAAERVRSAERLLADAQALEEKVAKHRTDAEVAAKTHRLLASVSARMATQIRPALEGQISAMLQTMSEGRFNAVRVSDDYEVTIADHDGRFYPVAEFSGGEADLIALSIRLALAQVVSARHGVGGAGFLILDEVFGSQDEIRRLAILDGLRRLRGTYGQILLISHVGGIEEAADTVIEVRPDEDDPEIARVTVS